MDELGEYVDLFNQARFRVQVVSDCDLDERQGPHNSVMWMSTRHTVIVVDLVTLCTPEEGAALMGQWVSQAVKAHMNNGTAQEATCTEMEGAYPAIYDFLTCTVGEGGKPRAVGSLTLFARTGSWHACLKDRATKKTWWGEGDTYPAALKALDAALQGI